MRRQLDFFNPVIFPILKNPNLQSAKNTGYPWGYLAPTSIPEI